MTLKRLSPSSFKITFKTATVTVENDHVSILDDKEPFEISGPGEYQVSGIRVFGHRDKPDAAPIYLVEGDDTSLGFFGKLDRLFADHFLEKFGSVDILVVEGEKVEEVAAAVQPAILVTEGEGEKVKELKIKSRSDLPEEMETVTLSHA